MNCTKDVYVPMEKVINAYICITNVCLNSSLVLLLYRTRSYNTICVYSSVLFTSGWRLIETRMKAQKIKNEEEKNVYMKDSDGS